MAETTISADVLDVKEINTPKFTGTIIKFWEIFDKDGQEGKTLWTAWFTADQKVTDIKPGDWVRFTGRIGATIGSYTGKDGQQRQSISWSLNNVRVVKLERTPLETPAQPLIPEEFPF